MLEKNISIDRWLNKKVNKINQVEYIINFLYNNGGTSKQISLLKDYKEQLNVEKRLYQPAKSKHLNRVLGNIGANTT